MPVQMEVTPRRRRDFFDHGEGFRIAILLAPDEQSRQDGGVVIDDGVGDQPRALIADLAFDVGSAGQFLLAADLGMAERS